jgi:carboxyl-terminal processing protease
MLKAHRRWILSFCLLPFLPLIVFAADKIPGGIGLAVVPTAEGELVVLKVVEKSPAAAAGMRAGDFIVQVDDFSLRGSDFAAVAARRLQGEAGTPVVLKFLRPGEAGVQTVTLKRIPLEPKMERNPGR